jgi:hypothetical protein
MLMQVHLLCLLSHAQQKNKLCCDELLKATALSLLPSEKISPSSWSTSTLTDFVFWFRQVIGIDQMLTENPSNMVRGIISLTLTNTDLLIFVYMNVDYFIKECMRVPFAVYLTVVSCSFSISLQKRPVSYTRI